MASTRNGINHSFHRSGNSAATQIHRIHNLYQKFRLACAQLVMLNNTIEDIDVRYDRASGENRKSYRYTLRLRLQTLEGVRNQFYKYANCMADILHELQLQLFNEAGIVWNPSLSVEMMEYSD